MTIPTSTTQMMCTLMGLEEFVHVETSPLVQIHAYTAFAGLATVLNVPYAVDDDWNKRCKEVIEKAEKQGLI